MEIVQAADKIALALGWGLISAVLVLGFLYVIGAFR